MTIDSDFRHEYARLVAALVRSVGIARIEIVEDAVQSAMLSALDAWVKRGMPDDPRAWLHRTAKNEMLGVLRKDAGHRRLLETVHEEETVEPSSATFASEVRDELLRMMFVCCDERIPLESRLVLALKTLCGFDVREIAFRLFTTEANVYKRLARGREKLQASIDTDAASTARLASVHAVIYMLFNEGYLSTRADHPIRVELCDEAIRLATLLAAHPIGATPSTSALLALMHFHAARLASRRDATGLLLLEEQDRSTWDPEHLAQGAVWLERSAMGVELTRFHAEAGIAAEHAFAPSFAETRWKEIAELYAMLERIDFSPFHVLNRAVAVAEWKGPEAGLAVLDGVVPASWLAGHFMWSAVLADLHRRAGHTEIARQHREHAITEAPSEAIRALLVKRLGA